MQEILCEMNSEDKSKIYQEAKHVADKSKSMFFVEVGDKVVTYAKLSRL